MQELFKAAIAQGDDLSKAKERLINEARQVYNDSNSAIERDYQTAMLVRFGLNQPEDSEAYAVARAVQEGYQQTYPPRENLAKLLMEDAEGS